MRKNFVTELEGEHLSAPEAITRLLRLQQIICGWFPTEDGGTEIDEKNTRLSALIDLLPDIQCKVIIWARFKRDIKAIGAALGKKAVSYYGEVSNDDREVAVDRFQNDPNVRYFIGQPQSGGIGLTLTAAECAIYYSNSFDLETRMQSEDRCHRIGTKITSLILTLRAQRPLTLKLLMHCVKRKI